MNKKPIKKPTFRPALIAVLLMSLAMTACGKEINYFDYVSELRSNILTADTAELSLHAYAVQKETPRNLDGVKREMTTRAEFYLTATRQEDYELYFEIDGKNYGGELSFDNVKLEYYYSCAADLSDIETLPVTLRYGETTLELTANTVKTQDTLSPKEILAHIQTAESETFKSLTDKNEFWGEICLRLIYEDAPYYYVGITDRDGNTLALLVSGKDGLILARREM